MSSADVRLDWQRSDRLGISEAIWGLHKTVDQIVAILEAFAARDQPALVTRVDEAKAEAVLNRCNTTVVRFEARARCLTSGAPPTLRPELGTVTVLSGGTSDLPVAAEAQLALQWHGIQAELLLDVG
ncbi:MAG: circadian phase modifier CpmA, partial [Synechococcus sp. s2_metabat2_7]|nr:circadian phase modifier CpmA [Synechococcus sp. s2_metabat2_7]